MSEQYNISDVSRISGIPKDLLRMWERRYGYPDPIRDDNGDRVYSDDQLDKLVLIRQLQDQGKRPGKLIELEVTELKSLLQAPAPEFDPSELIGYLKSGDISALRNWLHGQLISNGLRSFIHRVMVPATYAVGDAWSRGELATYEEHLFTELMKTLVRQSLSEHYQVGGQPRIMLTTVPGEKHSMGLLMVEALLRMGGAEVIPFGPEMPFKDIQQAAISHTVDIIGLSFSGSFKGDDAVVMLSGLRQMIEPSIGIWAGGAALQDVASIPEGIERLQGLHSVEQALLEWRQTHPVSV
ncbi:MerR family transcriptional regulator [Sedimenticola selenatireducens]|uniref:MerR family transcriptional regulator n=1 Tax=Sedimenticola selenatireducens TaxID=191960 RepID=A0A558DVX5_9GAMM|nr:MerR family transcriptional regulator [Sedimenticola selenatireducens]TVO77896.1 MerR family transcriptional regulator [Sedimenticola selenatireducens]TVT65201.1 MAG: MerR family transcriptional regulator [Sedimenticola selenatireducens]